MGFGVAERAQELAAHCGGRAPRKYHVAVLYMPMPLTLGRDRRRLIVRQAPRSFRAMNLWPVTVGDLRHFTLRATKLA